MTPDFKVALDLLGRQHVVERVVQRAQIGIDLLAHVAGQEAEALARFDGGARKDDALDDAALEAMGGVGDGDIGLAGAGRADAEHEIGLFQRANVGALHRRARLDDAAARGDLRLAVAGDALLARMADEAVEIAGADRLAGGRALIELLQHAARDLAGGFRPVQRDDVAVRMRLDAEAVFDQRKMAVVFAEQPRQVAVVLERDYQALVCRPAFWAIFPAQRPDSREMLPIGAPDVVRFELSL